MLEFVWNTAVFVIRHIVISLRIIFSPKYTCAFKSYLRDFYCNQKKKLNRYYTQLQRGKEDIARVLPTKGIWIDFGDGTDRSAEWIFKYGNPETYEKIYLVCTSLASLDNSRSLIEESKLDNVVAIEADPVIFVSKEKADLITFCYSLTSIPDWVNVLEHARALLGPGGKIAVTDFYVSRKSPVPGMRIHRYLVRQLWPFWFYCRNVYISSDHLPYLMSHFKSDFVLEKAIRSPLMGIEIPYYMFVGEKYSPAVDDESSIE